MKLMHRPLSLPGLTRQSIFSQENFDAKKQENFDAKKMDPRVKPAGDT